MLNHSSVFISTVHSMFTKRRSSSWRMPT